MATEKKQIKEHDFIIVGSGAGGGPLAANLSLAGYSVLLVEAGGDEINDNYSVPAFHAKSTEDPLYSWEFFVKHYSNNPERDIKYHKKDDYPEAPGIFYPRASGLGGCTTHHAMITAYPHESDWNYIANLVDDDSWNAENMRQYFDRIERPKYGDSSALLNLLNLKEKLKDSLQRFTSGRSDEGGTGWLPLRQADPKLLLRDKEGVLQVVKAAIRTAWEQGLQAMPDLNPNHPSVATDNLEGFNIIPISVDNGNRTGTRERVLQALEKLDDQAKQGKESGRLDVVTNTFVTNVVFADDNPKQAVGVRCISGEALYSARHRDRPIGQSEEPVTYLAEKEVILCGGAFNTPQLLMLSGIGPREELEKHGIEVRVESPGVGKNLQDRYEVGVVATAGNDFKLLEDATFESRKSLAGSDPDPVFTEWREEGKGIYATNGSVLGIIKRSSIQAETDPPDLYIFGVPGLFRGYEIGYSEEATRHKNYFTWAVLKGHTDNTSGEVTLRSNNPFDTPDIHFRYFEESAQPDSDDVQSVVDGIEFVQKINQRLERSGIITEQLAPKPGEDLHTFVRDNAWGHHASCTCSIGAEGDEQAVLNKDFQVRGVENLRVVDASVFPRIPGLFILASIYMISEKASDVIINKYNDTGR